MVNPLVMEQATKGGFMDFKKILDDEEFVLAYCSG